MIPKNKLENYESFNWTLELYIGAAANILPIAVLIGLICYLGGYSWQTGLVGTEAILLPIVAETARIALKNHLPNGMSDIENWTDKPK